MAAVLPYIPPPAIADSGFSPVPGWGGRRGSRLDWRCLGAADACAVRRAVRAQRDCRRSLGVSRSVFAAARPGRPQHGGAGARGAEEAEAGRAAGEARGERPQHPPPLAPCRPLPFSLSSACCPASSSPLPSHSHAPPFLLALNLPYKPLERGRRAGALSACGWKSTLPRVIKTMYLF